VNRGGGGQHGVPLNGGTPGPWDAENTVATEGTC
jgi:hypothetical protein